MNSQIEDYIMYLVCENIFGFTPFLDSSLTYFRSWHMRTLFLVNF